MRIIIVWFILCISVSAQIEEKSFFWEVNQFPGDTSSVVFITYRISHEQLVFVKDGNDYKSGFSLFIEAFKKSDVIGRISDSKNVVSENYSSTNSSSDYVEGLVTLQLPFGEVKLLADIDLLNTDRNIKIPPKDIFVSSKDSTKILHPLVVKDINSVDGADGYITYNYSGILPFSDKSYSLLIPVINTPSDELLFDFKQEDTLAVRASGIKVFSGIPAFQLQNGSICVTQGAGEPSAISFYLVSNFSTMLNEGKVSIEVKDYPSIKYCSMDVAWLQKPNSLFETEKAVKILKNIEKESVVNKILSVDKEKLYDELKKYWNKYDPDKSTSFNEVMNEFYSRVDTADFEFGSLDNNLGSESDRGKIYIKFGRPSNIQRTYNESNQTIEIWFYDGGINRKFIFEDKSGLGNYTLIN